MPLQAQVKHDSFRTSLSFEPQSSAESLSSSLQLGTENPPELPALSVPARHTHISWANMPAAPEPALARDRRSLDVGQLV